MAINAMPFVFWARVAEAVAALNEFWNQEKGASTLKLMEPIRSAWKRLSGVEAGEGQKTEGQRKTLMLPSILSPHPSSTNLMPKPTPANLRKFAETPVVRRAINVIKDRIASLDWQIKVKRGYVPAEVADLDARMAAIRRALEEPNDSDSFRTLVEQVLEDALVGGFGAIEIDLTGDGERPFALWPVDGATIRINPKWDGTQETPRYAQMTGRMGTDGLISLRDDELIYLRMNPRTHTPFGLGPLEVAFETVNAFLSANRFASKLASNSVVQYALWLNETTPAQHERLIRWWQDEIEGTGRVPLLSSEQKPEVLRFSSGTDADLRLNWQEFLMRLVANAFGLPPMMLGLEHDVNRSTAAEQGNEAFRSAIAPLAKLLAEHLTRDVLAKRLGWREFEFVFNELDARDEMTEVQIQTSLLKAGVLTVDEVRSMRGLGPLPTTQQDGIAGESRGEQ
ncbi:MAG TPA: phage portal protein [Acidisarcina sp.]|nr:phage portal protein [Acidisarcina sp.]